MIPIVSTVNWKFWPCMYWLFWALGFGFWETYAGVDKKHDIPMLTQAVVKYVPWWITLPLLTWGFIHFAVRYANPNYIK